MLHTKYQGSRASDLRQEVLSFLLGLTISDKKIEFDQRLFVNNVLMKKFSYKGPLGRMANSAKSVHLFKYCINK